MQIIAFISDFGLHDTWVGVCHATIKRGCPQAHVVDMGHMIEPFDVRAGAALAAAAVYQLPEAIHLVVVDPGVGSRRRDLCVHTNNGVRLVGPDNGILLPAAWRGGGIRQAYALDADKVNRRRPLATFHARDVLAPAAAALACGVSPESLGDPVDEASLVSAPFELYRIEPPYIACQVLEVDRFGSLRFNVPAEDLAVLGFASGKRVEARFGHANLLIEFGETFSDVAEGEPVFISDASGWLTLAVNKGSAFDRYGAEPGVPAHLRVRE
ncbi:MAG: S-adenosyl-l-methionine hydroxide adenosyltransferase family protein [Coriobacteriia bacterium]